jgi:hypothetical protein
MSELQVRVPVQPFEVLALPDVAAHEVSPELVAEIDEALVQVDGAFETGTHVVPESLKDVTRDSKDPQGPDGKKELYIK